MVNLHINYNGDKTYYQNNESHRSNKPAIILINGTKSWRQHNLCHRLDGPAVEWWDGDNFWWYKNQQINCNSQEEFDRLIKLRLLW